MDEFSAGDRIYKKIYFFIELSTDFTKCYLIKNIKKTKTSFGVSYLANIVNVDNKKDEIDEFEIVFIDKKNKIFIYAEHYFVNCICC